MGCFFSFVVMGELITPIKWVHGAQSFPTFYGKECVHKSLPRVPIPSQMQLIRVLPSYFNKISFNTVLPDIHVYLRSTGIPSSHIHLGLPSRLWLSVFLSKTLHAFLLLGACRMPRQFHPPWLDAPNNVRHGIQIMKLPMKHFPPASFYFLPHTLHSTHDSVLENQCAYFNVTDRVSHPC